MMPVGVKNKDSKQSSGQCENDGQSRALILWDLARWKANRKVIVETKSKGIYSSTMARVHSILGFLAPVASHQNN